MTGFKQSQFWLDRTAQNAPKPDTAKQYAIFLAEHTNVDRERYDAVKIAAIEAGKAVWAVRATDGDQGLVFDYFADHKHVGYIDFSDGIADIVLRTDDEELVHVDAIDIGEPHANLMDAIERLETFAQHVEN